MCRAAVDVCDLDETCNGTSNNCGTSTTCTAVGGNLGCKLTTQSSSAPETAYGTWFDTGIPQAVMVS